MTIMIVSFTPKEILFASDAFRYYLNEGTTEDVLNHKLEINHTNLKDHIETYETNAPKIHRITRNIGLICGGDGRFTDIIEGLNERRNIATQILQRLKRKGKIIAYWSCHIAQLGKLISIIYNNGEIKTEEQTTDNIWLDSFAPEMKDVFFKKYVTSFYYLGDTKEKTDILRKFFSEITELYDGLAGGSPVIAKIDKDGFKWIARPKRSRSQNFTAYSMNWMPDKIETESTTQYAWSQANYTDILSLTFECESKMLLFILAHCSVILSSAVDYARLRLVLDDVELSDTVIDVGHASFTEEKAHCYSVHTVQVSDKGSHTLKLQMESMIMYETVYAYARRLSILKSFYQGGST